MRVYAVRTPKGYLNRQFLHVADRQDMPGLWRRKGFAHRAANRFNHKYPTIQGAGPSAVVVAFDLVEVPSEDSVAFDVATEDEGRDFKRLSFCCPKCGGAYWGTVGFNPATGARGYGHCNTLNCRFFWERSKERDAELGIR